MYDNVSADVRLMQPTATYAANSHTSVMQLSISAQTAGMWCAHFLQFAVPLQILDWKAAPAPRAAVARVASSHDHVS